MFKLVECDLEHKNNKSKPSLMSIGGSFFLSLLLGLVAAFQIGCEAGLPIFQEIAGDGNHSANPTEPANPLLNFIADDFNLNDSGFWNTKLSAASSDNQVELVASGFKSNADLEQLQIGDPDTNMVAYWKLDDISASLVDNFWEGPASSIGTLGSIVPNELIDSSGANFGTLSSLPKFLPGRVHTGLQFSDDSIPSTQIATVPYSTDFHLGATDFTIMGWIYLNSSRDDNNNYQGVINARGGSSQGWVLKIVNSSGELEFYSSQGLSFSGAEIAEDRWTHFAVTRNFYNLDFYTNGVLTGSDSLGGNFTDVSSLGGEVLEIGNWGGNPLYGSLDDLSIWHSSLTAAEVKETYAKQSVINGMYQSQVFDLTKVGNPTSLEMMATSPAGKELPANGGVEIDYEAGNVSMTDNVVLLHLNQLTLNSVDIKSSLKDDSEKVSSLNVFCDVGTCPSLINDGRFNSALRFNGTDQFIGIDHTSKLEMAAGSFSIWFNPHELDREQGIMAKDRTNFGSGGHFRVVLKNDGSIYFRLQSLDTHVGLTSSPATINEVGHWYHLAVSFGAAGMHIYVNGVEVVARIDYTRGLNSSGLDNQENLVLGVDAQGGTGNYQGLTSYFKGDLDEFAIWNRQLNPLDIHAIYSRGIKTIGYQVRICETADCAENNKFFGPNVLAPYVSLFSELSIPGLSPNMTWDLQDKLSNATGSYFQYRAIFSSEHTAPLNSGLNLSIKSVNILGQK